MHRRAVVDAPAARDALRLMGRMRAHHAAHLLPTDLIGSVERFIVKDSLTDLLLHTVIGETISLTDRDVEVLRAPVTHEVLFAWEV